MTGRLLTASQVADRLELQASTIKRWGRVGRIPRIVLACNTIRYEMRPVLDALVRQSREREAAQGERAVEHAESGV